MNVTKLIFTFCLMQIFMCAASAENIEAVLQVMNNKEIVSASIKYRQYWVTVCLQYRGDPHVYTYEHRRPCPVCPDTHRYYYFEPADVFGSRSDCNGNHIACSMKGAKISHDISEKEYDKAEKFAKEYLASRSNCTIN